MKLDLDKLHGQHIGRRSGRTVYACSLVTGAVGTLPPGEVIIIFVRYMSRVSHFTRTLFEVFNAMDIEFPSKKGYNLYFKHRDISIKFIALGDEVHPNKEAKLLRGYPKDIQPIYDLD